MRVSEVTKVYDFCGGPLDGQQCAVPNRYGGSLPPQFYECRVREPLTLAASWEEYKDTVVHKTSRLHRYYYALEYDCYKYLGAA